MKKLTPQQRFIGVWLKWYAGRRDIPEGSVMINGRHGKAAKELIAFFKQNESDPEETLGLILSNWDKLPEYLSTHDELWNIVNNFNKITHYVTSQTTGGNKNHSKQTAIDRAISERLHGH